MKPKLVLKTASSLQFLRTSKLYWVEITLQKEAILAGAISHGMDIRKIGNIWSVVVGPIEREVDGKVTQPAIYFTNKTGYDSAVRGNERGTKWGMGNLERNCCGYCLCNLDWLL